MVTSIRFIVGIIGSVVCVLLYAVPMLTFKRVIKEASVGEFSCMPYILALFSALTWGWYGFPVVSDGWENLTLFGTCAVGVLFEFSFIVIYVWFAPKDKKKFVMVMLSLVLAMLCMIVSFSSFIFHTHRLRKLFVGSIGIATSMSMYSSPLVAVKQVMKTKSVEFMPFYLSLFSLLTSFTWMLYGILGRDPYITAPNGAGCLTGILQLVVYFIYSRCDGPTKTAKDIEQINSLVVLLECRLTFKRVIKEASVGEFSCIPYILTLFSSLTWGWYSFPIVSNGWENLSIFGTCAFGVLFEFSFIVIYLWFAPREKKKFVILLLSLALATLCLIVSFSSFIFHTHHLRKLFVGSIGMVTAMSMYSSPLVAVKQVMKTKSVEFMPFYLSLFTLLTCLIWMIYGILGRDPYVTAPNVVGSLTGILQLVVYCVYRSCNEPTKTLNDIEQY
ncbi:hypothetical protein U9M48_042611 [Paspalum notatum var. saurae]|uniref:Bidirectional sugar transporter SWEET n=1 Tax=Paspalum notatum var. saurae TaxID=547442 RepID=A0AAQ3XHT1_PASNO